MASLAAEPAVEKKAGKMVEVVEVAVAAAAVERVERVGEAMAEAA